MLPRLNSLLAQWSVDRGLKRVLVLAGGSLVIGAAIWFGNAALGGAPPSGETVPVVTSGLPLGDVPILDLEAVADMGLKLGLVAGLIYGLFWLLKRFKRSGGATAAGFGLDLVESLSLGNQRQVHVIRAGGKLVLIGATASQITRLAELDDEPAELGDPAEWESNPDQLRGYSVGALELVSGGFAAEPKSPASFAERLKRMR